MIILDTVNKKLQVVLAGAKATNDCPWSSFTTSLTADASAVPVGAHAYGVTNGVTAVDTVAVPTSGKIKKLNFFTLENMDTATVTVTIQILDTATVVPIWSGVLAVGDVLQYRDGSGFFITDINGAQKTAALNQGRLYRGPQIKTAGTTYIPPAGVTRIVVECQGGGGGGGGASFSTNGALGGGGGAGGYALKAFDVTAGTTYTYAIGAAGTAGANTGGTGGAGGVTTFAVGGVTVTATGGLGGIGLTASATAQVVLGGASSAVSTNGDINATGACGQNGVMLTGGATPVGGSGSGGSSRFGGGGQGRNTNGAGSAGIGYGSGGGGAFALSASALGGVGTIGIITIAEYY